MPATIHGGRPPLMHGRPERAARTVRRGFTLLEVLISLAILTVGSTCIVALYGAAMETYRLSELEFTATNLGLEILDTAEDMLAHGASPALLPAEIKARVGEPPSRFVYDVTLEEVVPGCVRVTATIRGDARGALRRWVWQRAVLVTSPAEVAPLPAEAPRRYN